MRPLRQTLPMWVLALAVSTLSSTSAGAQVTGVESWRATREEIQADIARLEQLAASPAYSASMRGRARAAAQAGRDRLQRGDFRVGDRIHLRVEGSVAFDDTVAVVAGPRIVVPTLGDVELGGVLRAELPMRAQTVFRRGVLDAVVVARPLARLAVFGTVGAPGYHFVSYESRLDELLSIAGGPTVDSRPDRFTVMRGDTVLLEARDVGSAIAEARTVGDLQLRDGDYLRVEPRSPPWERSAILSLVGLMLTPLVTSLLVR